MSRSDFIWFQELLIDEVVCTLYHGGLAPKPSASNVVSVFLILDKNEFDNRPEPYMSHLGYVEIQGEDTVAVKFEDVHAPRTYIELADPEFHTKILRYFQVEEYRIYMFNESWGKSRATLQPQK